MWRYPKSGVGGLEPSTSYSSQSSYYDKYNGDGDGDGDGGRRSSSFYGRNNRSSYKNRKLRNMNPSTYRRSQSQRSESRAQNSSNSYRRTLSRESSNQRSFKRSVSYLRDTPPPESYDDEPEPVPPLMESMEVLKGYEGTTFTLVDVPPPSVPIAQAEEDEPCRTPLPKVTELTDSDARQALLNYVANRYCYGKRTAKEMTVTKIENTCAFHYVLETFSERRQTCWAFEPYVGGHVDGPLAGPPPSPWDVDICPPEKFQNHSTSSQIPHTETIKTCHSCGGVGRKRCYTCTGSGWETCYSCQGDGYKPLPMIQGENERCYHCNTTGRRRCWKCHGEGQTSCRGCSGTGQIKCFIKLTVTWTNHMDDHVVDKGSIPEEKIKLVSGEVVFEEEHTRLWPINHFPETTINLASAQLVLKHAESYFSSEKPLVQRQRVQVIPISTVYYKWKGKVRTFIVFGLEQNVHAPDYPQTCCFGCNIL